MRLRRSNPDGPGWTRRRSGRGFTYLDAEGARLADDDVARVVELAIPPAWQDVWICPFPNGHIQAIGTDDAGRRQYLYHPQWRARRDRLKHDRVLEVAARLPAARRAARRDLAGRTMTRRRALATAFCLLDLGLFRVGGEKYREENGSFGLATVEKRHTTVTADAVTFDYPAKSGQRRRVTVADPDVRRAVAQLLRRRGGGEQLLAYREGNRWCDVTSRDIGGYVKELLGEDATSKDLRTWNATVLAAVALAAAPTDEERPARYVRKAVEQVAETLGDTTAVARKSYVDPRVIDRFEDGETIANGDSVPRSRTGAERAVVELLAAD